MALQDFFNKLVLIHEVVQKDGLGTHTESYRNILEFQGAIVTKSSSYSTRGEQPTPSSVYELTTTKDIPLKFNDIIYDESTRSYYQITNEKRQTPKSAGLSIQQYDTRKIKINMI